MLVTAGSVEVTPTVPSPLGANGLPNVPWRRVADTLEVNALVVHEEPSPLVILTVDALFIGSYLRGLVEAGLQDLVPPQRLWLSASHTHRAPAMDPDKPLLGVPSAAFVEGLAEQAVRLVTDLLQSSPSEAVIHASSAHARHAIHRRRAGRPRLSGDGFAWGGITMAPNPDVACDERVRRYDVLDPAGRRLAVLWHYACHPTAAPDRLAVSAEFPGVARERLRDLYGEVPVLFLQGFSGDVRPPSIATYRDDFVRRLRLGPHFRDFTPDEFARWSGSLAEVVGGAESVETGQTASPIVNRRIEVPASQFFEGAAPGATVSFQRIALGPLHMVGVGAELVSAYQALLEECAGDAEILGVGCLDAANGYIATSRQLAEGGYEAGGFCHLFGLTGVNPDVEDNVRRAFRQVLD